MALAFSDSEDDVDLVGSKVSLCLIVREGEWSLVLEVVTRLEGDTDDEKLPLVKVAEDARVCVRTIVAVADSERTVGVSSFVKLLESVFTANDSLFVARAESETENVDVAFPLPVVVRPPPDRDSVAEGLGERDEDGVSDRPVREWEGDELFDRDMEGDGESESDGEIVGRDRDGVGVTGGVKVIVSVSVNSGVGLRSVLLLDPVTSGRLNVVVCVGVAGGVIVGVPVSDISPLAE